MSLAGFTLPPPADYFRSDAHRRSGFLYPVLCSLSPLHIHKRFTGQTERGRGYYSEGLSKASGLQGSGSEPDTAAALLGLWPARDKCAPVQTRPRLYTEHAALNVQLGLAAPYELLPSATNAP